MPGLFVLGVCARASEEACRREAFEGGTENKFKVNTAGFGPGPSWAPSFEGVFILSGWSICEVPTSTMLPSDLIRGPVREPPSLCRG